jgi:hypothetical protein
MKMDDKKIFKILQSWFPELAEQSIPKKKYRQTFQQFLAWILPESIADHYLMSVVFKSPLDNQLQQSAVLKDLALNFEDIQQNIQNRIQPLYAHYEKHKEVIGKYYNINDQVFDLVLEEICVLLKRHDFALLLIYADATYWMAVPNQDVKIYKFCKSFSKQFKNEGICIEHYTQLDCLRST